MKIYFEELAKHKRAGGIESACSQLVDQMLTRNVTIVRSAKESWNSAGSLPDCVHIQGLWSPSLAKRFWRWKKLGVPCVVSPHGMLEPWALSHKFWRKKVAWWIYQKTILNRADAVHATSVAEAIQFGKLGLTSRHCVIPWGVPSSAKSLPAKKARQQRTAIFAGRLCPVKGLPMLIEAWKRVQPADWQLQIVGPDESNYRAVLEGLVAANDLSQVIRFEGEFSRQQLKAACQQADLFVLPSYSENFGMVVGEALALGLPVLTTNATPWQRIAETKCGWWVSPSVDAITSALREATTTAPSELQAMGAIGAELIKREFSWDIAANKFRDLYASLACSAMASGK